MSFLSNAFKAWRAAPEIKDAIVHHDRTQLALRITGFLTLAITFTKGTKYGQYLAFMDADFLTGLGLVIAGVIAEYGHWSAKGTIISVANGGLGAPSDWGEAGALGQRAGAARAQPAEQRASDSVQPGPDALSRQDNESMHAGG